MNTPSLHGRYSKIVIYIICLGAAYFLIYTPFTLLISNNSTKHQYLYSIISTILTQVTALIYPFLIVYRSWMVYFQIKWNIAIEDTKWSIFIDTTSKQNNFFLKHYETNKKYASKLIILIWSLFSIPALFFAFLNSPIALIVYGLQYFTPILLLFILLCNIPNYDDHFMIKNEIKLVIIASIITTILYVPFLILQSIVPIYGIFLLRLYTLFGPFCILYPHVWYPLNKFNLPKTWCSLRMYRRTDALMNHLENTETGTQIDIDTENDKEPEFGLKECLQNKDGFLVFARHINKEFAIENILFLIEIYQFKQRLFSIYGQDNILRDDDDILEDVAFPEDVMPKSTLVSNMDNDNIFQCVSELFIKYVEDEGYFAINIAFHSRQVLYKKFKYNKSMMNQMDVAKVLGDNIKDKVGENDVFHLFDPVLREIYNLLKGSFLRFKQCQEYERLMKTSVDHTNGNNNTRRETE